MFYDMFERGRLWLRDEYYLSRSLTNFRKPSPQSPLVLCNSFPKSGTHLLAQILLQFGKVRPWSELVSVQSLSGAMNTRSHIRWKLASAPAGALVRSHLTYQAEVREILAGFPVKRLFVYRDLRDVAVSHVTWVLNEPRETLHHIYKALPDFDACLMEAIEGTRPGTPFGSQLYKADIATDFRRYQGWIGDPDTLAIRFEDLVGERGGGSEDVRIERIAAIARHLDVPLSDAQLRARFGSVAMDPAASHTYRAGNKGAIGGWQGRFRPEHKQAFKRVAGNLLIELGYETGTDW